MRIEGGRTKCKGRSQDKERRQKKGKSEISIVFRSPISTSALNHLLFIAEMINCSANSIAKHRNGKIIICSI